MRTVLNNGEPTEGSRGMCRRETNVVVFVLEKLNHSGGKWPWKVEDRTRSEKPCGDSPPRALGS